MGAISNLLPLVILFVVVGAFAFVGYQVGPFPSYNNAHATGADMAQQMYLWTNDLANQGKKTMEKKNVMFTKDGMKVGVKEMSEEEYADRTQRCVSLLRTLATRQSNTHDTTFFDPFDPLC
ncbi:hypothetical protein QM012_003583 [Aureobasidium pullulans]|uniref:DUF3533 domain-containing protein n=1 Tax=Aureobasidium pullulans TaxID=5580 RepID=A0ABR0T8U4_AURPU